MIIDKIVSCLFIIDIIVRIMAVGIEDYCDGEWNLLDVTMIILSFISSVIFDAQSLSALFKIVRMFRVFPIFKQVFKC